MSETKEPELLPCPFCGSKAKYHMDTDECDDEILVTCTNDFCPANVHCGALRQETFEDAADDWNCRVPAPAPQWTAEPPTEEGWYFYYVPYRGASPVHLHFNIHFREKKLLLDTGKSVASFSKDNPDALWLKIELPPLP